MVAPIASSHKRPTPAAQTAHVDFGVCQSALWAHRPAFRKTRPTATGPIIGGASDPCAYKLHILTPEETTIRRGGEVTFQIHGVVHSIAIYRVDKNTTRDQVGQFLCPGEDPADSPDFHPCLTAGPSNAAARHVIYDGAGDVVIVAAPNVTAAHPDNRVWSDARPTHVGRRSTGSQRRHHPRRSTSNGQLPTHQFLKPRPLPGDLHEAFTLPERLDVWFRQRDWRRRLKAPTCVRHESGRPASIARPPASLGETSTRSPETLHAVG